MKFRASSAMTSVVLSACFALGGVGWASAQNVNGTPTFGRATLTAGFTPDPHRVNVYAGGSIDVYKDTGLPAACVGAIASAPDYSVTYTPGSLPLVFRTLSSADTTLVINGPDGNWYCDDDSYGDGDAQVQFQKPKSGRYDVWVGVLGVTGANATLLITETP